MNAPDSGIHFVGSYTVVVHFEKLRVACLVAFGVDCSYCCLYDFAESIDFDSLEESAGLEHLDERIEVVELAVLTESEDCLKRSVHFLMLNFGSTSPWPVADWFIDSDC